MSPYKKYYYQRPRVQAETRAKEVTVEEILEWLRNRKSANIRSLLNYIEHINTCNVKSILFPNNQNYWHHFDRSRNALCAENWRETFQALSCLQVNEETVMLAARAKLYTKRPSDAISLFLLHMELLMKKPFDPIKKQKRRLQANEAILNSDIQFPGIINESVKKFALLGVLFQDESIPKIQRISTSFQQRCALRLFNLCMVNNCLDEIDCFLKLFPNMLSFGESSEIISSLMALMLTPDLKSYKDSTYESILRMVAKILQGDQYLIEFVKIVVVSPVLSKFIDICHIAIIRIKNIDESRQICLNTVLTCFRQLIHFESFQFLSKMLPRDIDIVSPRLHNVILDEAANVVSIEHVHSMIRFLLALNGCPIIGPRLPKEIFIPIKLVEIHNNNDDDDNNNKIEELIGDLKSCGFLEIHQLACCYLLSKKMYKYAKSVLDIVSNHIKSNSDRQTLIILNSYYRIHCRLCIMTNRYEEVNIKGLHGYDLEILFHLLLPSLNPLLILKIANDLFDKHPTETVYLKSYFVDQREIEAVKNDTVTIDRMVAWLYPFYRRDLTQSFGFNALLNYEKSIKELTDELIEEIAIIKCLHIIVDQKNDFNNVLETAKNIFNQSNSSNRTALLIQIHVLFQRKAFDEIFDLFKTQKHFVDSFLLLKVTQAVVFQHVQMRFRCSRYIKESGGELLWQIARETCQRHKNDLLSEQIEHGAKECIVTMYMSAFAMKPAKRVLRECLSDLTSKVCVCCLHRHCYLNTKLTTTENLINGIFKSNIKLPNDQNFYKELLLNDLMYIMDCKHWYIFGVQVKNIAHMKKYSSVEQRMDSIWFQLLSQKNFISTTAIKRYLCNHEELLDSNFNFEPFYVSHTNEQIIRRMSFVSSICCRQKYADGNLKESLMWACRTVSINPDSIENWTLLSHILYQMNSTKLAIKAAICAESVASSSNALFTQFPQRWQIAQLFTNLNLALLYLSKNYLVKAESLIVNAKSQNPFYGSTCPAWFAAYISCNLKKLGRNVNKDPSIKYHILEACPYVLRYQIQKIRGCHKLGVLLKNNKIWPLPTNNYIRLCLQILIECLKINKFDHMPRIKHEFSFIFCLLFDYLQMSFEQDRLNFKSECQNEIEETNENRNNIALILKQNEAKCSTNIRREFRPVEPTWPSLLEENAIEEKVKDLLIKDDNSLVNSIVASDVFQYIQFPSDFIERLFNPKLFKDTPSDDIAYIEVECVEDLVMDILPRMVDIVADTLDEQQRLKTSQLISTDQSDSILGDEIYSVPKLRTEDIINQPIASSLNESASSNDTINDEDVDMDAFTKDLMPLTRLPQQDQIKFNKDDKRAVRIRKTEMFGALLELQGCYKQAYDIYSLRMLDQRKDEIRAARVRCLSLQGLNKRALQLIQSFDEHGPLVRNEIVIVFSKLKKFDKAIYLAQREADIRNDPMWENVGQLLIARKIALGFNDNFNLDEFTQLLNTIDYNANSFLYPDHDPEKNYYRHINKVLIAHLDGNYRECYRLFEERTTTNACTNGFQMLVAQTDIAEYKTGIEELDNSWEFLQYRLQAMDNALYVTQSFYIQKYNFSLRHAPILYDLFKRIVALGKAIGDDEEKKKAFEELLKYTNAISVKMFEREYPPQLFCLMMRHLFPFLQLHIMK